MHELHRAEYLAALGVTSYMPRFLLPLAPEPRQAELPMARDSGLGTRGSGSEVPSAKLELKVALPVSPAAKRADFGILDSVTAESRVPSPESRNSDVSTEVNPFILSCWWLGDELLAIDSREPGTALPLEALFDNIARALNWHELSRERDRLRWPMAENRYAAAADASDARDTCASWLEAACARKPVKSIWLMGRQARDFCSPVPLTQPVSEWNGIRLLAMPSLSQLLQQPLRKRDLWQLLQKTYPEQV